MSGARITVSRNLINLTGSGEEWLQDKNGNIIAVFIDGNFKQSYCINITDADKDTVSVA